MHVAWREDNELSGFWMHLSNATFVIFLTASYKNNQMWKAHTIIIALCCSCIKACWKCSLSHQLFHTLLTPFQTSFLLAFCLLLLWRNRVCRRAQAALQPSFSNNDSFSTNISIILFLWYSKWIRVNCKPSYHNVLQRTVLFIYRDILHCLKGIHSIDHFSNDCVNII